MVVVVLFMVFIRNIWMVIGGLLFGVDTPQPIFFHLLVILFCGMIAGLYIWFQSIS